MAESSNDASVSPGGEEQSGRSQSHLCRSLSPTVGRAIGKFRLVGLCSWFVSYLLRHWLAGGRWVWGAMGWFLVCWFASVSAAAPVSSRLLVCLFVSVDLGRWLGDIICLSVARLGRRGLGCLVVGASCVLWLVVCCCGGAGGFVCRPASGVLGRLLSLVSMGSVGCGSVRLSALVVLCRWSRLALIFLAMPRLVFLFFAAFFGPGLCVEVSSCSSSASAAGSCWLFSASVAAGLVCVVSSGAWPLSLSLYIITRVAPHCVNTLRILHAAYDATNTTCPLVNTSLSLSLSLSCPAHSTAHRPPRW